MPSNIPLGSYFHHARFFEVTSDEGYQPLLSNDEHTVSLVLDALGYLRHIGLDLAFLLDFVL